MFGYISPQRLCDKITLAIISVIVFTILYMTTAKNENKIGFDTNKLSESALYSLSVQCFKFDFVDISGGLLFLTMIQVIISYIILIL